MTHKAAQLRESLRGAAHPNSRAGITVLAKVLEWLIWVLTRDVNRNHLDSVSKVYVPAPIVSTIGGGRNM